MAGGSDFDADWGLFGPRSVTWRVHADPAMLIGGIRALLIQALNPLAMAAVAHSSTFRTDPWGQLERTFQYVLTTTYGDTNTAQAAGAQVRAIHRRVRGVDEVTGLAYRADDPDLLLWVHCAEVDSFLAAYRHYGGRLSDEESDRYVAEMVNAAHLVGLSARDVPRSAHALRSYLDSAARICVTPAARAAANMLLAPQVPLARRAVWTVSLLAAISILPRNVRDLYGFPWLEPVDPALRSSVFCIYRAMNVVFPRPAVVREALARSAKSQRASAPRDNAHGTSRAPPPLAER
jgi:uncharacterized protein (DUF2236 family)